MDKDNLTTEEELQERGISSPLAQLQALHKPHALTKVCDFVLLSLSEKLVLEAYDVAMARTEGSQDMLKFLLGKVLSSPIGNNTSSNSEVKKGEGAKEDMLVRYNNLIEQCNEQVNPKVIEGECQVYDES